jgi:uncharacterized membrane protein
MNRNEGTYVSVNIRISMLVNVTSYVHSYTVITNLGLHQGLYCIMMSTNTYKWLSVARNKKSLIFQIKCCINVLVKFTCFSLSLFCENTADDESNNIVILRIEIISGHRRASP